MNTALKLEQLISLLNQEIEIHRSMQDVVDREKEAALRSDLDALRQTTVEKEKLISEIHQKETLRRQSVVDLAAALGIADQELTLTKIAREVDEPFAGTLRRVNENFSAVIRKLQTANERNKLIIAHSLALLRGSFNLLNELLAPSTVYFSTGNLQSSKSTGKWVCGEM